jgi:NADH dehydrogenase [ubiquinone] 1 alpha subcomplex assembly factor 7
MRCEKGRKTMKNPLESYLADLIRKQGPISVAQFMEIALGHPQHGYYMKQDPFGRGGDFITAPEISQMFGEIIGAWTADIWKQLGSPAEFSLAECGPGRGTLMSDLMRSTKNIPGFHDACNIHLIEISPALKEKQKSALADYNVAWHDSIDALPQGRPLILIANEFLDALPVQQYVQTKEGWQERVVTVNETNDFEFSPFSSGEIVESSPARIAFADRLCTLLEKTTGAALLIDYGAAYSGTGDTLQAVYKHKPVNVFSHIGDADLTSHVDFEALIRNIDPARIKISGPVEQGAFLKENGIAARAAALSGNATAEQKTDIENSLKRLVNSDQMGALFKVMGLSCGKNIDPAGFRSA